MAAGHKASVEAAAVPSGTDGVYEKQPRAAAPVESSAAAGRNKAAAAGTPRATAFALVGVFSILFILGALVASQQKILQKLRKDDVTPSVPPEVPEEPPEQPLPSPLSSSVEEEAEADEQADEQAEEQHTPEEPSRSPSPSPSPPTQEEGQEDVDKPLFPRVHSPLPPLVESPVPTMVESPLPPAPEKHSDLPDLDDIPRSLERGKDALFLAAEMGSLSSSVEKGKLLGRKLWGMTKAAAQALTGGALKSIVDATITLSERNLVSSETFLGLAGQPLHIERIIGFGPTSVYFTATTFYQTTYTIRLPVFPLSAGLAAGDCWRSLEREKQAVAHACGKENLNVASERRGLLIPLSVATVDGMASETVTEYGFVLNEVTIMKPLLANLAKVLAYLPDHGADTAAAKEYTARRLLLQTLQLHEAGVSHNGLRPQSIFVDTSGGFLLAGMEAVTLYGEDLPADAELSTVYAEPQLVKEFDEYMQGGAPVKANEKSDLWSLGVLLYEVFTGKEFKELMQEGQTFDETAASNADIQLAIVSTPPVWKDLVLRLLQTKREKRISHSEILQEFSSLL